MSGLINKEFIQGFMDLYPTGESGEEGGVKLIPKTGYAANAADATGPAVDYPHARKMPAGTDWAESVGLDGSVENCEWHLWDEGQSVKPQADYVILQDDGSRWEIKSVNRDLMGAMHTCLCVRLPST